MSTVLISLDIQQQELHFHTTDNSASLFVLTSALPQRPSEYVRCHVNNGCKAGDCPTLFEFYGTTTIYEIHPLLKHFGVDFCTSFIIANKSLMLGFEREDFN